jgi:hypothetical protein
MKKLMLVLAVLFVTMSAASAMALNICVEDTLGNFMKFDGVKLQNGKSTPLAGRYEFGNGNNTPIHGVVTVDSDKITTRIVLTYSNVFTNEIAIFTMVGDKLFNAAGNYDIDPIGSIDFNNVVWSNIPCNTFLPAFKSGPSGGHNRLRPE